MSGEQFSLFHPSKGARRDLLTIAPSLLSIVDELEKCNSPSIGITGCSSSPGLLVATPPLSEGDIPPLDNPGPHLGLKSPTRFRFCASTLVDSQHPDDDDLLRTH